MTFSDDVRRRHDAIYADHVVPEFRFWQVGERLWAGRNPLSERDLRELAERGVTHVLDLREESEWNGPGRFGSEAVASAAAVGIERLNVPIGDFSAPGDAAFTRAAAWLDERFAEPGSVVFAHCRAGLQRTPTILAAWLARREGIGFGEAVERLRRDGYPGRPLPEQRLAAERWLESPAGRERSRAKVGPTLASRVSGDLSLTSRIRGDRSLTSRIRGSLLGGALGDALGAPIEFMQWPAIRAKWGPQGLTHFVPAYGVPPGVGAITDDTQMTLFTVEGLIRAGVRYEAKGLCHPPSVVHHAYRRWLATQGERREEAVSGRLPGDLSDLSEPSELDGWLIGERFLHARRAPGNTCLGALRERGGLGDAAKNDSKGCGAVMRAAPVGFLFGEGPRGMERVFALAVEIAALTHGHRSGQLPAGVLAAVIHQIAFSKATLEESLAAATTVLRDEPRHEETLAALTAAQALALKGAPSAEKIETLGGGWVAEEALAIAVYAALSHPQDLRAALILAANHSGDSDSTAAICGNLLGALLGEAALPADWLAELEGCEVIAQLADDFSRQLEGAAPNLAASSPRTPEADAWWARYPG